GGTYAEIAVDQAYTDGNLVSAPAWPAHPAWMAQFLAVLGTKITPIAAVCHGAQILAARRAEGPHLLGVSCLRARSPAGGGTYAEIAVDQAYTDGNLVSAPAWPAHPAWMA
ncbi:protease, partial [Methylobacterium radiotolerans]